MKDVSICNPKTMAPNMKKSFLKSYPFPMEHLIVIGQA